MAGQLPDSEAGLIGTVLDGKYQILSLVGLGSAWILFRARHQLMGRIVLIKMPRSFLDFDQESSRLFLEEAKALSIMDQPYSGKVFDYGISGENRPYLVL